MINDGNRIKKCYKNRLTKLFNNYKKNIIICGRLCISVIDVFMHLIERN